MARDLSFWKEETSQERCAADTYKALLSGEKLDLEIKDDFIRTLDLIEGINNNSIAVNREAAIITPYYIDRKQYELYHYELFVDKGTTFEEYLLKKTGKKTLEEVSESIVELRKKCFINLDEINTDIRSKIMEYFEMLLNDRDLQEEIKGVFNSFDEKNLFVEIY